MDPSFFKRFSTIIPSMICMVLLLHACFLQPLSLDGLPCNENDECPTNETCHKGICYSQASLSSLEPRTKPSEDSGEKTIVEERDVISGCKTNPTQCKCFQQCDETTGQCKDIQCKEHKDCRCGWYCNAKGSCQVDEPPKPECDKDNPCKLCDMSCDQQLNICRITNCKADTDCRCGWFCHKEKGRCFKEKEHQVETCNLHEDCKSLRCVDGICLGPCKKTEDCFNGRVCFQGRCEKPRENETCIPDVGCADDLFCHKEKTLSICRKKCDPLKDTCETGKTCSYLERTVNEKPLALCLTPIAGAGINESCNATDKLCATGLYCRSDGKENACRKLCDPNKNDKDCKSDEKCMTAFAGVKNIGLCMKPTCSILPSICGSGEVCYEGQCQRSCASTLNCSSSQFCKEVKTGTKICVEKQCQQSQKHCEFGYECKNYECIKDPKIIDCKQDSDCSTGYECAEYKLGKLKKCLKPCTSSQSDPCPGTNYLCVPFSGKPIKDYCVPKRGGRGRSIVCSHSQLKFCEWNHVCTQSYSNSYCLQKCDPTVISNNKRCPTSYKCARLQGYDLGVCINSKERKEGETCGLISGICESSYVCAAFNYFFYCKKPCTGSFSCKLSESCHIASGDTKGVCRKNCNTSNDCGSAESCSRLSSTSNNYVCIPK